MTEEGQWIPPLGAGRKPAGLALLGWLADARAPRLCRVTGAPGSGKSHLLAWLVAAGTSERTPADRRIQVAVPAAGYSVRSLVWSIGSQLGVVAGTVQDLLTALAEDGRPTVVCLPGLNRAADPARVVSGLLNPLLDLPQLRLVVEAPTGSPEAQALTRSAVPEAAVLDLDDPQWTDRARFGRWCLKEAGDPAHYPNPAAALGRSTEPEQPGLAELAARIPANPDGSPDLLGAGPELLSAFWTAAAREGHAGRLQADPLLLALAGPVAVTAALEDEEGPVVRAWHAAGPALIGLASPADRAATLRTRLLGTDEAATARLATVPASWAGEWALWQTAGEAWPGPVTALAVGHGPYAGQLLVADPTGEIRTLDTATGHPRGRLVVNGPRPLRALAATAGGTVVLLDARGGTELLPPAQPAPGLDPYALDGALGVLRAAAGAELSALAAAPGLPGAPPAVGDASGAVHWAEGGAGLSERLHDGPVTALGAAAVFGGAGPSAPGFPVLVSGGFDGAVRLWGPGTAPTAEAVDRRGCPVTAVAVTVGPAGPVVAAAWADGHVRVRRLSDPNGVRNLQLGSAVWSLALAGDLLVLGMPDGVVAVRPV